MISILKSDVPEYLRTSPLFANAFFEILADDEDQHIEVPSDCFKCTPDVLSESDLHALLKTVRFWMIPEYAESNSQFLSFVIRNKEVLERLIPEFQQYFPFLSKLHAAVQPSATCAIFKNAMEAGLLGLIQHLHEAGTPLQAQGLTNFTSFAAQHGHANCLAYGLQNGCVLKGNECRLAVIGGHVEAFRFAAENGCAITTSTLALAAELNRSEIIKYACERGVPLDTTLSAAAIKGKSLECLQILITHSCPVPDSGCETTVVSGAFDCLRCLHEGGAPWSPAVVSAAVIHDRTECLAYLLDQGCPVGPDAAVLAARRGGIQSLRFLHQHGAAQWSPEVIDAAIRQGSFPCMKYALKQGCPFSADVCNLVVLIRNLKYLAFLHRRGAPLTEDVTRTALMMDRPQILKYALKHGYPLGNDACLLAARFGDKHGVACMTMAHAQGAPWSEEVVKVCIEQRNFDQALYALRNGCPFSADACVEAARVGSVTVLKCLHEEHGAIITPEVVEAAKTDRRAECVEYAIAHLDVMYNFDKCATAAGNGDIIALMILREWGAPWDERTCLAAIRSNALECLQYAVKNGCPVDATLPEEAARHGNLNILSYLFEVGCPWDGRTMAAAVQSGSRECLDFALCKNCPFEVV